MENKRFIELKRTHLILSILFGVILYLLLLKYFNMEVDISNTKYKDYYQKYSMFIPIIFSLFSLLFFYILTLIKFILRLHFLFITILIYFIVYGFFLILGIDLMFFESRYADFALVIINTFSIPLIISSSIVLFMVILLSFKKQKVD